MNNPISQYLDQIQTLLNTGVAREHAHRAALQNLLISLQSTINVINEPRRIECGSPDLVILDSQADNVPLGYIEAKDIGVSLNKALKNEQLKRYLDFSDNLILTDYLEFRWFVKHEQQPKIIIRLAKIDKYGHLQFLPESFSDFENLIDIFVHTQAITLRNPSDLAARMAKIAIPMRDAVLTAYHKEKTSPLREQFDSFRSILLDSLTVEQFSDMYAQTACYGLFAAKCNASLTEPFSRINANHCVPKTNPFLRNLFNQIVGIDIDDRLIWAVEHLVAVLNHADIAAILEDFGKRTRREDPVVHFYETFLQHYDPSMREMRGVYYTPEPVVSYIVRSVDLLLKQQFKLRNGLADSSRLESGLHKVQILDPAVGTGTFLYAVFNQIFAKFRNNKGMWSSYVSEHLLPRVHGFELLMAPYTVAHTKLGLQLQELGYEFQSNERLRIFLTNSLEDAFDKGNTPNLPFAEWLVNEGLAASGVKQDSPVMVIVGNPPYSYDSLNKGDWISQLIRDYYQVDDKPLKERNPKGLQDDYVKFIRFAQWRIEQTGYGILGFITNHGYLDNPTFRGMRQHLLTGFDEIYVLDLHGNAKKKEKALDGSVDKNVFDIQQGVAISLLVKHRQSDNKPAKVFHADLWGERDGKYHWLEEQDVTTTQWTKLEPQSPFYLLIPYDPKLLPEYEQGWKITDAMPIHSMGVKTNRDRILIDMQLEMLTHRIGELASDDISVTDVKEKYNLEDGRYWNTNRERQKLQSCNWMESIVDCIYRPFDSRKMLYMPTLIEIGRGGASKKVMQHMLMKNNLALISVRQVAEGIFNHIFATRNIVESRVTLSNKGAGYLFPLYIYPTEKDKFLNGNGEAKRKPNFAPNFIKDLENRLNLEFIDDGTGNLTKTIGPEDIFHYMYAIFHSPTYRQRYAEFLKIDFPRLPLTSDKKLFKQLGKLGKQLVGTHLMEADIETKSSYPIEGDNIVEKITYKDEKVYINKTQYFDNVKENIWQFHIGGYQVCQKWLKDRKGKELSYDDCNHYLYILAALEQTIDLMEKIDATLPEFPLF
ncbi:type ISP restriction/modification enzyme [Candidatus Parabeggiatoa sp. HSG14]|uniref:type ISP restriction/modification enzyme n=1 Tax=Candidatus Parabeggiatoa sp. HSG14 TaxID=3055593 RepID=UPI0025A69272|nr:N-6 DNA methylase [Thiotrichales bacterium HSG14]